MAIHLVTMATTCPPLLLPSMGLLGEIVTVLSKVCSQKPSPSVGIQACVQYGFVCSSFLQYTI